MYAHPCACVYTHAARNISHTKNTFSVYIIYIFFSVARDVWKSGVRVSRAIIPSRGRPHACWHHFSPSRWRPATCLLWRCLQRSHGNGSCDQSVVRRAPGNTRRGVYRVGLCLLSYRRRSLRGLVILSVFLRTLTVRRSTERTIWRDAKRGWLDCPEKWRTWHTVPGSGVVFMCCSPLTRRSGLGTSRTDVILATVIPKWCVSR